MTRSINIARAVADPTLDEPASYRSQWSWEKIGLAQAWRSIAQMQCKRSMSDEPIVVAIVDWGIQRDHEAFNPELVMPSATVIGDANDNLRDDDGHGTMLAGTIAGIVRNVPGGGATSPVRLFAIKFIDVRNPPMSSNAAKAIRRAVDAGAKIINASWDVGLNSLEVRGAIKYAEDHKVLVVVAAGNSGGNNGDYLCFPASLSFANVINVMASDVEDEKPGFSNYGENVHIAAPGVAIISSSPYAFRPGIVAPFTIDAYRRYSGTSPAAAHVSGAAALLLSINPGWNPQQIRACLVDGADRVPALEPFCHAGRRLNLRRAVEIALQTKAYPPPGGGISEPGQRPPRAIVRTRLPLSESIGYSGAVRAAA
jgi:subtilisin family serine protease